MAIVSGSTDNRALLEERYRQYIEDTGMDGDGGEFGKLLGKDNGHIQSQSPPNPPASGYEPGNHDLTGGVHPPQHIVSHDPQRGYHSRHERGGEGGDGSGDGLREKANDLRARANDLRNQADEVEGQSPDLAQTLRNRAIALDQRADTVDERADIAVERGRIAEEGRLLNGVQSQEANAGWISERELRVYANALEGALADVAEFGGDIEVSASREAKEAEVDAFLDRAEINGATTEDLELIEGYADAFPIQFVFVDNLISDYGMESAAGGPITVEGTTTILVDSSFRDTDFTRVSDVEDPDVAEQGTAAVEFAYDSILEIFDLPGATAADGGEVVPAGATTAPVIPLAEGGDAAIVATPAVSTTAAVPTVESTDEDDEAKAYANAAVSGAGDFDADE